MAATSPGAVRPPEPPTERTPTVFTALAGVVADPFARPPQPG